MCTEFLKSVLLLSQILCWGYLIKQKWLEKSLGRRCKFVIKSVDLGLERETAQCLRARSQHQHCSSKPSVSSITGNSRPSLAFYEHQAHICCIYICRQAYITYIIVIIYVIIIMYIIRLFSMYTKHSLLLCFFRETW